MVKEADLKIFFVRKSPFAPLNANTWSWNSWTRLWAFKNATLYFSRSQLALLYISPLCQYDILTLRHVILSLPSLITLYKVNIFLFILCLHLSLLSVLSVFLSISIFTRVSFYHSFSFSFIFFKHVYWKIFYTSLPYFPFTFMSHVSL